MMTWMKKKIAVAAVCALVLTGAGGNGTALAEHDDGPDEHDEPAVRGKIVAAGQGTVTFQTKKGQSVTVAVNDATVVKVGGKAATLADLKAGMAGYAFVKEGQPAMEIRAYMPKAPTSQPAKPAVGGTVTAVGADTITLQPGTGPAVTVSVNAGTVFQVNGKAGQLADVKAGMRAYAFGREGQPATEVRAYTPRPHATRPAAPKGVSGIVTAVGESSVTIQPHTGEAVTVAVNAATVYKVGSKGASLSDVKVGMRCGALGEPGQPAKEVHAYMPTR